MPDSAHLRIIRNDSGNDIGESVRRQAAENCICVATDCSAILTQEPLDQTVAGTKLAANDGGPKSEGIFVVHLTEVLSPTVQVVGVGEIILTVVPLPAGEDAVCADMDQSDSSLLADVRDLVKEGVYCNTLRTAAVGSCLTMPMQLATTSGLHALIAFSTVEMLSADMSFRRSGFI